MKNKTVLICLIFTLFFLFPFISHAEHPALVRILAYYADNDGHIAFKWQQDYDGCRAAPFDCSGGIQLGNLDFPFNGGEGFYDAETNFGDNWVFTNFTTTCNEFMTAGRICTSYPKAIVSRNSATQVAFNPYGLLYSDVETYVNPGGRMHTILGGIFRVIPDQNYRIAKVNHISFGDPELPYIGQQITPVLIVPGLAGTEFRENGSLLWANLNRMFNDFDDGFLDDLSLKADLTPNSQMASLGQVIKLADLFGANVFDYTDALIAEFENQGYIEGQTLFTFPYDWRYGVSGKFTDGTTNVDLLKQKVADILLQTGSNKIDVVAHSMGGLLVKKYALDNPASHHIGKAVFVGVPNTGSIKSVKTLLEGDNLGMFFLNQQEIKKIAENMPAMYDLLPTQAYYDLAGSFVKTVKQDGGSVLFPQLIEKDLNYSEFKSYITDTHGLNALALTGATALHSQSFDNADLRQLGVDLYAINGCNGGTIKHITEYNTKNLLGQDITTYAVKLGEGDNTVPFESSTSLPINQDHKYYSLVANHSTMMTQDGSRQEIVNLISGSNLFVNSNKITQDVSRCGLNGKAISIFSPVDILVKDQQGNKLGLDGSGNIFNEIPNADFELLGDHKFLYLPTDSGQIYSIDLRGTGSGTYTIKDQDIQNSQVVGTQVFSNLPVTNTLVGSMNIGSSASSADGQDNLVMRQTPQSQPQIILPSSVVSGNKAEDVVPPYAAATLSGSKGQNTFYRSDVKVSIKAADENSGVLKIHYMVDGATEVVANGDTANLTVSAEGNHAVTFFATDKNGNNSSVQTVSFVIDKAVPEIIMQFNVAQKDLTFNAQDNNSGAIIVDGDDVITATDQAGNVTEISLKDRNRKKGMKAEIKSLKYNGVVADLNKNKLAITWQYDKAGNLKSLSQQIQSRKEYNISLDYDGAKTKLSGKDAGGKISQNLNGLVLLKLSTVKGDLSWSY